MAHKEKIPMQTTKIVNIIEETPKVRLVELDCALGGAMPGQFIMVWLPEMGERPMSIVSDDPLTIMVCNAGRVSGEMHKLNEGGLLSFRGPFGNGFRPPEGKKKIVIVGGGYGTAPLYFLAKRMTGAGIPVEAVVGAKTKAWLALAKKLAVVANNMHITTDDGSAGRKGVVTDVLKELLNEHEFSCVYACGPEKMLHAVALLCRENGAQCQLSLERYMKCGFGVCGSCDIGGRLVCRDGPVFSGEEALSFEEFGKSHRDASGTSVGI